ncbi:SCO family protein [Mucilaginibacter jinjuensis]|uniref:SCO family protein n=1 Tax=Mucilaginibacter jinjuensis TaxID=1176721 RepID=A0ABY7T9E2_9SPHI|nr:SCO family protein [Mucilaginibacter jinjuensis]WCT12918.1 SCO family protein [Mucilaginibacter jinjuensis]
MNKNTTVKKVLILVLILAVPGFLYYLLTAKGKNRYKPLPFYGPKVVAQTGHKFHGKYIPDTIYHKLPDFNLVDQDNQPVSLKSFDNKIFVAGFFYTHCPSICDQVNSNLDSLVKGYAHNKMLHFVSITVDPMHDSPAILKAYAGKQVSSAKWQFLTGDTTTIYNLAAKGFLVNAAHAGNNEFVVDDKLVLIDADKRIRGYYSGTSIIDMNRLNDEIKVLIAEELRKIKAPDL